MNNKGFIRTLEAVIAVIIILGIILAVAPEKNKQESATPANVREAQSFILNQIATNNQYRDCIIKTTVEGECSIVCIGIANVDTLVRDNVPKQYDYRCEICNSASTCSGPLPLDKSLYTDSRFIATNPARIVRLIFWEQ